MLAVEGLCKRFGGFLAVNQVSFEVREGEILGLIGPNGSGKSTTFNLIAGTLRPTAGSIRFQGGEIASLPAHNICRRALVAPSKFLGRFEDFRSSRTWRLPLIMAATACCRARKPGNALRKHSISSGCRAIKK